ncbi:MAG: hypothetical protein ACYTBX_15725 [Planctomycetota bacterium]
MGTQTNANDRNNQKNLANFVRVVLKHPTMVIEDEKADSKPEKGYFMRTLAV